MVPSVLHLRTSCCYRILSFYAPGMLFNHANFTPQSPIILEDDPTRMRLNVELRALRQQPLPFKRDSLYRDIEERPSGANSIHSSFQSPYNENCHTPPNPNSFLVARKRVSQTYRQQRAVILEPHERKTLGLLSQLSALENERLRKRKEKEGRGSDKHQKQVAKEAEMKTEKLNRAKMETLASNHGKTS